MKILALSDHEDPFLYDYYQPGRLKDYDLILSCGDLKPSYLRFLVTMGRAPLLYIHGNHDERYKNDPPDGCDSIEDTIYTYRGLRILGLGGCPKYRSGAHQYTEREMERRIRRLWWKLRRSGGVDIILTHAPPAGYGDGSDYAHRGWECLVPLLIEKYRPRYLLHGHVHPNYGETLSRELTCGETQIINVYEKYILEI